MKCSFAFPAYDWSFLNVEHIFAGTETGALIYSWALVVGVGTGDELFPYKQTEKECEKITEYYKEFNANENFKLVVFEGLHKLDKKDEEFDFFFDKLINWQVSKGRELLWKR